MDKKIVATPIPPDQPEASPVIMRTAGVCLVVGLVAIVGGSFWPVVGPWLIAAGILISVVAFVLLIPYWRPRVDAPKRDDIRKLFGRHEV
jgi:membrane protein implicated in regulation of membrane protease activity